MRQELLDRRARDHLRPGALPLGDQRQIQEQCFLVAAAVDLEADGEAGAAEPRGNRHRRKAGDVPGDREGAGVELADEHVADLVGDRPFRVERLVGVGGADDEVDLLEQRSDGLVELDAERLEPSGVLGPVEVDERQALARKEEAWRARLAPVVDSFALRVPERLRVVTRPSPPRSLAQTLLHKLRKARACIREVGYRGFVRIVYHKARTQLGRLWR